jgi:hypothetical protein
MDARGEADRKIVFDIRPVGISPSPPQQVSQAKTAAKKKAPKGAATLEPVAKSQPKHGALTGSAAVERRLPVVRTGAVSTLWVAFGLRAHVEVTEAGATQGTATQAARLYPFGSVCLRVTLLSEVWQGGYANDNGSL